MGDSVASPYFVLTKPPSAPVHTNRENQLVYLNRRNVYLLPENNLTYYVQHGLFESQLIEWCKQYCRKDRVFLDIGAHTGTYSISLAGLCKSVHSFEPQRMTYYALCGSVALSYISNIYCWNVGLGSPDQVGKQTLAIVSPDGGGSTIQPTNERILETETIEVRTLDSFDLDDIGFIKMDVEENELSVLQGARETLERCGRPTMLFESNRVNRELFSYIEEIGYNIIQVSGCVNMYLAVGEPTVPPTTPSL